MYQKRDQLKDAKRYALLNFNLRSSKDSWKELLAFGYFGLQLKKPKASVNRQGCFKFCLEEPK